jgi:DNA-binding PadR family transcriptional regulator
MTNRSPLAVAVLALLRESPIHPYGMQQLMRERGIDRVINVRQRASLYQTIGRLERAGLIAVRRTVRNENRPGRTIYELSGEGRETLEVWLREILAAPGQEFPDFPAALAFLALLAPDEARRVLEARTIVLRGEVARLDSRLAVQHDAVPRLLVLQTEYTRAVVAAELEWVRAIADDLRSGRLTWPR